MSTYAGNAALSAAVKDRVLSTFQQAVALFKQGRTDEVMQGCGLILRMDPMFDPAKKLLEKARNPSAAVDVDALLAAAAPANDPLREAREAMGGRDFQRVVDITTEVLTNDLLNDDARMLNEQAREKLEAAPFVDQFIRKAEQYAQSGNPTAARAELERARSLDEDHPGLRRLEQGLTIQSPPPPAAPAAFSFDSPAAPAFSFDAPPSFVVDNPAAPPATPGRGTAQAADFGFTFEEEKPAPPAAPSFSFEAQPAAPPPAEAPSFSFDAPSTPAAAPEAPSFSFDATPPPAPPVSSGFSFDAPAPAPAAPSSGGFSFDAPPPAAGFGFDAPAPAAFDFSSSPAADTGDQKKIQQYLGDGDRAYDSGDYQTAIDLWSRIFLIDVTNEEASQRIERAKLKRRDFDAKVEAIVAEGVQAWERKDNDTAREKFAEALRIDPSNATAHDNMERLSDAVTEGGAAGYEAPFVPPPASTHDLVEDDDLGVSGSYEAPAAPSIATKKPAAKKAPAPVAKPASSPMKLVVLLLILVLLAGGGYFAYSKFFAKPEYDPAATQGIFHQAEALAKRGKYDQAIAMLQDVKADDPQHDKALQMISDLQLKKTQASEMIDGRPAAVVYQESLSSGKASFDAHDYDAAKKSFDTAARVKALPPDMQALYDQAAQKVAKLDAAKGLFREQKYSDAVIALQALQQEDPQNASIRRMLNDAHFNLGAAALQEEKTTDAMKEFDEVLKSDAGDDLAKRSRTLAERYDGQPKDLLYKIYVKYLPLRQQG